MKARPGKRAIARRFYLIFVLLFALAVWTSSTSAVERTGPVPPVPEQTTAQPSQSPDSAGEAQQAESAPQPAPTATEQSLQVQAEQGAKPEANMPPPATEPEAALLTEPSAPQTPVAAATQTEAAGVGCPPEYVPLILKTNTALMTANFTFYPIKTLDPFVPFVSAHDTGRGRTKNRGSSPHASAKNDSGRNRKRAQGDHLG